MKQVGVRSLENSGQYSTRKDDFSQIFTLTRVYFVTRNTRACTCCFFARFWMSYEREWIIRTVAMAVEKESKMAE